VALGWATACCAQVDLTRPFTPDADTVALYHLDDLATGQMADAVGGPAGPVAGVTATLGRFDRAAVMNGVGGWIDVLQPRSAATGRGLTVECWVKFRQGARSDVVCRNMAYMLRIDGAIQAYIAIDGAWRKVIGHRGVPTGRWTHLAMTYDCATKEIRTYIDGRLDAAQVPEGVTAGVLSVGNDVLRLGANTWTPEGSVLDGKLDEARISSVARQYAPLPADLAAPIPADTNLIPNPSFEFGLRGWRSDGEANARLQWRIDTTGAPEGRAFISSTEPGRYSLISHPISIAPGKTHTVSALLRSDQPARMTLALAGTGLPSEAKRPISARDFDVTPEWKRVSFRYAVPEDWPADRAYVGITKPAGATLSVDAVSLVLGESDAFSQPEAQSVGVAALMPQGNLFAAGSPASLAVEVVNAGGTDRRLRADYRLTNYLGAEAAAGKVFEGTVPAKAAAPAKVELPTSEVGWFTLTFTVSEDGQRLSESQETMNVVEPMTGRGDALTSPLGMNTHMEREPDQHLDCNLSALSQCGVKWVRAWWGWGMAEKEPGKFDWTEFDRQFDAVRRAGMEIMPILLRYYPNYEQAWAGKVDQIQQPPYDLDQWGDFVTATVTRYRGRVKAWEVWNEPQYTMDAATYAEILKVTTDRAKAADPDVLVIGLGGDGLDFVKGVLEAGATGFDVLSHHSYAQLGRPWEQMGKLAADTTALTEQYHATSRVWHSEQGLGADGVGYIYLPSTEEQCAVTLVQSYLSALSTAVERFFWFSAQTSPTYGWGVFYEDYVPRPRLIALNGLARVLAERKVTGRVDLCDGKVACVLLDGEAGPAAAVWNLSGSLSLTLPTSEALAFRDMLGNPLRQAAGRPPLLERGRPVYVTAKGLSTAQLRDLLLQAKAAPAGASFPLTATVAKTGDGKLEVRVANVTSDSVDARVRVAAPELFTAPPEAVQLPDFAGEATQTVTLTPARRPQTETEVTVTLEVGDDAIRQQVVRGKVHP
jgi:hypothetical protein